MPTVSYTRVRPRFGDVIEIATANGLAYALYTHRHSDPPKWGAILRIIPGIFQRRPDEFQQLVELEPQFITFFPLGAACNRRLVHIVTSVVIPEAARAFPIFRSRIPPAPPGRAGVHRSYPYHFWDGTRQWRQDKLLAGQEDLPIQQIINDTMLRTKIEKGWRHRDTL